VPPVICAMRSAMAIPCRGSRDRVRRMRRSNVPFRARSGAAPWRPPRSISTFDIESATIAEAGAGGQASVLEPSPALSAG
jgi:hypothetical protein